MKKVFKNIFILISGKTQTQSLKLNKLTKNMSQVTPVSKIPRSVLTLGPTAGKKSRPNTPQSNTTGSNDPFSAQINIIPLTEENLPKSPKEKRRISNDSQKLRNSPRSQVDEKEVSLEKKEKVKDTSNGVQAKETNGSTNGNHSNETNGEANKDASKKKDEKKKINGDKNEQKTDEIILAEKNEQEMEALVVESEPVDSPMPGKGKGRTSSKILTPRIKAPAAGRISPFKKVGDKLENVSTIANLSTVSEQSTEASSSNTSPAIDNSSPITRPPTRVSGRRSTRPIKDIQMTHYRSGVNLNDSTSSTNATLGSPINYDSLRTPITAQLIARKRKDGSPTLDGFVDSPSKRVRIDFSGMLSYVTTPVTLLKSGLSRINFTSSTPRKLEVENDEPVANVSGAMEIEESKDEKVPIDSAKDSALEIIEDDLKKEPSDIANIVDEDISIKETTNPNRSFCVIM